MSVDRAMTGIDEKDRPAEAGGKDVAGECPTHRTWLVACPDHSDGARAERVFKISNRHSVCAEPLALQASFERLDHDHLERAQDVVMLLDGHIFSGPEHMIAEAVARFVVVRIAEHVVMERP